MQAITLVSRLALDASISCLSIVRLQEQAKSKGVEWPEGMMRVSLCMCFHASDDDRDHGRIALYLDASLVPLHEIKCCHRLIAQLSEEDLIARVCTGEGGHKFCRLWSLGLHDERYFGCKSHDASLCGLKHLSQPRTNSDPIRLTQSI